MEKKEYEAQLFDRILKAFERRGVRDCVSSIILTGSFGRGEPVYLISEVGPKLKSDIEIGVVFKDLSAKKKLEQLLRQIAGEFKEDLNLMLISENRVTKQCNFNFSLVSPKYKTLFTYDLFHGSKTLWGKDFLANSGLELSSVDPYEAKRIVANRIGELIWLQQNQKGEDAEYRRMQWKGKLILAIVTGLLLCEDTYVSSYHGQRSKIMERSKDIDGLMGISFLEDYRKVFSFLREDGVPYEVEDDKLRGYITDINRYFKKKNIASPRINSVCRWIKYYIKYLKAGMNYGILGFEDHILQALMDEFSTGDPRLTHTARIWHEVLY